MRATSEEIAIFVAVVESGSFSRAAEQLGQANSAVSRAVKKLESKLGVSLLNRTTRQLSLTEEGERYFRRMQVVLQEMAAAENDLLETRTTPRGLLRVDAATPVMLHFLMPLVKPFRERYPEMTLSLVSSETFINLIERKVDVAIRAGTLTDSSLRARPLFTSYRKISRLARLCRALRYAAASIRSETASLPRLHRAGIAEYLAGLLLRWPAVRDRSGGVIQ